QLLALDGQEVPSVQNGAKITRLLLSFRRPGARLCRLRFRHSVLAPGLRRIGRCRRRLRGRRRFGFAEQFREQPIEQAHKSCLVRVEKREQAVPTSRRRPGTFTKPGARPPGRGTPLPEPGLAVWPRAKEQRPWGSNHGPRSTAAERRRNRLG